jgi:hypothetical protein
MSAFSPRNEASGECVDGELAECFVLSRHTLSLDEPSGCEGVLGAFGRSRALLSSMLMIASCNSLTTAPGCDHDLYGDGGRGQRFLPQRRPVTDLPAPPAPIMTERRSSNAHHRPDRPQTPRARSRHGRRDLPPARRPIRRTTVPDPRRTVAARPSVHLIGPPGPAARGDQVMEVFSLLHLGDQTFPHPPTVVWLAGRRPRPRHPGVRGRPPGWCAVAGGTRHRRRTGDRLRQPHPPGPTR